MRFADYIKDKILEGIVLITAMAVMLIFMTAFHVSGQLTAVIILIHIIASLSFFLLDFLEREDSIMIFRRILRILTKSILSVKL